MTDGWEMDGDNISLLPLVGWRTAVAPGAGLVQLQYVYSDEQLQSGEVEPLQLAMTAEQCRLLAGALLEMAREIDAQPHR